MPAYTSLIDAWREQAVSRFGQALVAEMASHGGPEAYCELVGVKKPTMGTWVRNTSKPGPAGAGKLAHDHYNPCRQGTYLRVAERIGVDGANVAVHATYETEE